MEKTHTEQIIPLIDKNALNLQLQNYEAIIKVRVDSNDLQRQLQSALSKTTQIPIEFKAATPSPKEKDSFISFLSDASSYSIKTVMPSVG